MATVGLRTETNDGRRNLTPRADASRASLSLGSPPRNPPQAAPNPTGAANLEEGRFTGATADANAGASAFANANACANACANALANATADASFSKGVQMNLQLLFAEPGYIAHPYTKAMYQLIEIQKISGANRARSESKKREALEAQLRGLGMTYEDYLTLEATAKEPFFYGPSPSPTPPPTPTPAPTPTSTRRIIIPGDRFLAFLVNASDAAPRKMRVMGIRHKITATAFITDKTAPDGTFDRFAVVTSPTGKLSNQRAFRSNPYIKNFTATGSLKFDSHQVNPESLLSLIQWGAREIGIGACRKMGFGRCTVKEVNGDSQ